MNYLLALGVLVLATSYFFWPIVAWVVSRDRVFQALYRRAEKTPYWHLEGYMDRWWLFNPVLTKYVELGEDLEGQPIVRQYKIAKYRWCPISIRMHHILRADNARHKHNHPGSFRTIIGEGHYVESREDGLGPRLMSKGMTSTLRHGEFHHIDSVGFDGVWTIFIMWGWKTSWGFKLDDGTVVDYRDYHNGGKP